MSAPTPDSTQPYRTVGRYRVYSELASGGMATVHLGCLLGPAGFSKLVAIKCLHEQYAVEEEFVSMFLDEARLASSIHHPNVVASLDVVSEQGELLVVMEYVHGESLAVLLRSSRQTADFPPVAVVTRIVCDALEGLHAAHTASLAGQCLNIVHRDVSPQNIMVGADGNTRVLDFGIAQAALRSQVTAAGIVKGKIAYMSPEQVQGRAVDARTDIFAAGVVLWEALTGRRLFFAPEARDAVDLLLTSPIPAPSAIVPTLSAELDRVVLRALARDPEQRFQSAHDFAEALRRAAEEGSRREVADWVGRVAKDGLSQRQGLLHALEASAIHTQARAVPPVVSRSSPRAAVVPVLEGTQTRATSITSILPTPEPPRWRKRAPWWVAAAGLVSAVAAGVFLAEPPPRASAAAPFAESAVATSTPTPPRTPSAVVDGAALSPAAEPTPPTLAAESLPLAPAVTAQPAKRKIVKALPRPTEGPAPVSTTTKSCSPPYRIDAEGVRRIKPECL
jgi:eukaryotic-like serine/threonine-protein kinase